MDLDLEMEKTVRNMSWYDKYGIGTEFRKRSLSTHFFWVKKLEPVQLELFRTEEKVKNEKK